jgi:hypothetical protein
MMKKQDLPLVNIETAAEYCHVHKVTVYQWTKLKGFPLRQRGRFIGVRLSELRTWVNSEYPKLLTNKRPNMPRTSPLVHIHKALSEEVLPDEG